MKNITKLSVTIGITTCYGDKSILDTIRSIRRSKGTGSFQIILVADRTPLQKELKEQLKNYHVTVIENKTEGSLTKKQKQILSLTKTDLIFFIQDDVLLDKNTFFTVIKRFQNHPKTTMISILNSPVPATAFFEDIINVGTELANKFAYYWNHGDNYLSVIGRFMAFRTNALKKFKIPNEISSVDAFYYFENKRNDGVYEYISQVSVYFKNPQNIAGHLRKSSRFQYSEFELSRYFRDIKSEYKIPKSAVFKGVSKLFLKKPVKTMVYLLIYFYTRVARIKPSVVLDPLWEVDTSTKKVLY